MLLDDEDDVHELQRLLATRGLSDLMTTLNNDLEDLVMDDEESFVTSEASNVSTFGTALMFS